MTDYLSGIKFFLEYESTITEISEPVKFDQVKLKLERNDFHGFKPNVIQDGLNLGFQNTSLSLARDIILDRYENNGGSDSEIFFSFGTCENGVYTRIFKGRLNFNTFEDKLHTFEVSAERDSFEELLRTRIETKISPTSAETVDGTPSTPLAPIVQELHSKELLKRFLQSEEFEEETTPAISADNILRFFTSGSPFGGTEFNSGTFYIQIGELLNTKVGEILQTFGIAFDHTQDGFELGQANEFTSLINFTESGEVDIRLDIENMMFLPSGDAVTRLDCSGDFGAYQDIEYQLFLLVRDSANNTKSKILVDAFKVSDFTGNTCPSSSTNKFYKNFSFLSTQQIDIGDSIIFYIECFAYGTFRKPLFGEESFIDHTIRLEGSSSLNISLKTISEPSNANVFLPFELYEKVIRDATNEPDRLRSSILGRVDSAPFSYNEDGRSAYISRTNGFQIRQFPIEEKPPYFSFIDLIESDSFTSGLGYGFIEQNGINRVLIEDWKFFYKDEDIFPEPLIVHDYSVLPANEIKWNELKVGYAKWGDEELNHLDEFASKSEYTSGLQTYKKKLPRVSKYLASGYLIELLRREPFTDFSSKDNDFDNDIFFISLLKENGDLVTERNQLFNEINNVFSPDTVYNASISKSFMVYNFIEWLSSCLTRKDQGSHEIRFSFGEGNILAEFDKIGVPTILKENGNFAVSDFTGIFKPERYKASANVTYSQYLEILNKKYNTLSFYDNCGEVKRGWIHDLEFDQNSSIITFKLVAKNE